MPSVFMFILAYFTSIVKSRSNSFLEPTTNDGKVSCSRKQRDCCSNVCHSCWFNNWYYLLL